MPAASSLRYRTGSEQMRTLKAVSISSKYSGDVWGVLGCTSMALCVSRLKRVWEVRAGRHLAKFSRKAGLRMAVALVRWAGVRRASLCDRKMVKKRMLSCLKGAALHPLGD